MISLMKQCYLCRRRRPKSAFNKKKVGVLQPYCKQCQSKKHREYYLRHKKEVVARVMRNAAKQRRRLYEFTNSFKNKPCTDCHEKYPPYVMDFDHITGKKRNMISKLVGGAYSLLRIKDELKKCDLVCANCHRVRTFTRRKKAPKYLSVN